jgi:hypothetical protein
MDIKFTEIDDNFDTNHGETSFDINNYESHPDGNTQKYWEKNNATNEKKQKKVTYDDILSSLNMVVNKNGVLQYIGLNNNNSTDANNANAGVEPQLKNSYIYNKYFKDYADASKPEIKIRRPQTIEEYKQMLLEDKINRIQARNRIAQIKPTTLLFNDVNRIKASHHNLRKMHL